MTWFAWVLILVFSLNVLWYLAQLGGFEPDQLDPLGLGIAVLINTLLIMGIVIWL